MRSTGLWTVAQTLRHLVFATDAWVKRTILDEPMPYQPHGVTHTAYPASNAAALGLALGARVSFTEVRDLAVLEAR